MSWKEVEVINPCDAFIYVPFPIPEHHPCFTIMLSVIDTKAIQPKYWMAGFNSQPEQEIFLLSTASKLVLRPTQPPV
jgi:hypothetical protein